MFPTFFSIKPQFAMLPIRLTTSITNQQFGQSTSTSSPPLYIEAVASQALTGIPWHIVAGLKKTKYATRERGCPFFC